MKFRLIRLEGCTPDRVHPRLVVVVVAGGRRPPRGGLALVVVVALETPPLFKSDNLSLVTCFCVPQTSRLICPRLEGHFRSPTRPFCVLLSARRTSSF